MIIKNWVFSFLLMLPFCNATSIYDIEVQSADGTRISLSKFRGNKLLITTVPAGKESKQKINYLSSLAANDKTLQVIAVPALDDSTRILRQAQHQDETVLLSDIKASDMLVTKPMNTFRKSNYEQHALFRWLTNYKLNGHFDAPWTGTGEYFLISDDGQLYAVLSADVPKKVLEDALRNGGKE